MTKKKLVFNVDDVLLKDIDMGAKKLNINRTNLIRLLLAQNCKKIVTEKEQEKVSKKRIAIDIDLDLCNVLSEYAKKNEISRSMFIKKILKDSL